MFEEYIAWKSAPTPAPLLSTNSNPTRGTTGVIEEWTVV